MKKIMEVLLSVFCFFLIYVLFEVAIDAEKLSNFELLSFGGTIATFASLIIAVCVILEERCEKNIDQYNEILFTEILKQKRWKRWSFLERKTTAKLSDGNFFRQTLTNPHLSFSTNKTSFTVCIPTVPKDCFDLPIYVDCLLLNVLKNRIITKATSPEEQIEDKSFIADEVCKYWCVLSILNNAVIYNLCFHLRISGICITILSIIFTIFNLL